MRRVILLLVFVAASASAQDSSFNRLRLRAGLLRLPVVGHIADDWKPSTGAQVDIASNVGASELSLSVGHIGFDALTGKPPFTETLFSLAWTRAVLRPGSIGLEGGARLTDVRMDFDDPALVGGLRTEEEQLLSILARGRLAFSRRYAGFVEASYGVLMTSTRTSTLGVVVGVQRDGTMPEWLRGLLR